RAGSAFRAKVRRAFERLGEVAVELLVIPGEDRRARDLAVVDPHDPEDARELGGRVDGAHAERRAVLDAPAAAGGADHRKRLHLDGPAPVGAGRRGARDAEELGDARAVDALVAAA